MSTLVNPELTTMRPAPAGAHAKQGPTSAGWEVLCGWLAQDLRGMMTTIERREKGGDWVVECLSYPLESVTTRQTANGVRVISISIRMNGACKLFEISGPNFIGLRRNAAGWPIRVELGYEEGQVVLLFSGQMDPQRRSSRNSWGE